MQCFAQLASRVPRLAQYFCLNGRDSQRAREQRARCEVILAAREEQLYGEVGQCEKRELLKRFEVCAYCSHDVALRCSLCVLLVHVEWIKV